MSLNNNFFKQIFCESSSSIHSFDQGLTRMANNFFVSGCIAVAHPGLCVQHLSATDCHQKLKLGNKVNSFSCPFH